MTFTADTQVLTEKTENKVHITQRAMEKSMLSISCIVPILKIEVRKESGVVAVV